MKDKHLNTARIVGAVAFCLAAMPVLAQSIDTTDSIRTENQLISDVPEGTPPLQVTSDTVVPNLNADQVDGLEGTDLAASIAALQSRSITINLGAVDLEYTSAASQPTRTSIGPFTHPILNFANNARRQIDLSVPIPPDYDYVSNVFIRLIFSTALADATVRWRVSISALRSGANAALTPPAGTTTLANASSTGGGLAEVRFFFGPSPSDALAWHITIQRQGDVTPIDTADNVFLHGITVMYN